MTNAANKWIKKALVELRRSMGGKCQHCGSKRNLVFAHERRTPILKERSKKKVGRKERYYDVKRHPKSYILLCRKCNVKMDKKKKGK